MADQKPNLNSLLAAILAQGPPASLLENALSPGPSGLQGLAALDTSPTSLNGLFGLINSQPYSTPPSSLTNGLLSFGLVPTPSVPPPSWIYVKRRFDIFQSNMKLTPAQLTDCARQQGDVIACLNRQYWGSASKTDNGTLIGSWGKDTHVRPPRDADVMFMLPADDYWGFEKRPGNRQSQLLQEIRATLAGTYSRTELRADGQVVVVPFQTPIEIVPAFACLGGSIIVCDTNGGGRYVTSTSAAEMENLNGWDAYYGGNVRKLVRMLKHWQYECNVPLKSFILERLAFHFLQSWNNSHGNSFWHDWMVRDFFAYLLNRANSHIVMPGTNEPYPLGNAWLSRAQTAHSRAIKACDYERQNAEALASDEWQKVFGAAIPVRVS
jgi:hypothetical protein